MRGRKANWLARVKEELLALGVVSLVLLFVEPSLETICVSTKKASGYEDHYNSTYPSVSPPPPAYSSSYSTFTCPYGYRQVFPRKVISAAHYLLFYLAVVHILFSLLTSVITNVKLQHWSVLERTARKEQNIPAVAMLRMANATSRATDPANQRLVFRIRETWRDAIGFVDQDLYSLLRFMCEKRFRAHSVVLRNFNFLNMCEQCLEAELNEVYSHAWLLVFMMALLLLYNRVVYQIVWISGLCLALMALMSGNLRWVMKKTAREARNLWRQVQGLTDLERDGLDGPEDEAALVVDAGLQGDVGGGPQGHMVQQGGGGGHGKVEMTGVRVGGGGGSSSGAPEYAWKGHQGQQQQQQQQAGGVGGDVESGDVAVQQRLDQMLQQHQQQQMLLLQQHQQMLQHHGGAAPNGPISPNGQAAAKPAKQLRFAPGPIGESTEITRNGCSPTSGGRAAAVAAAGQGCLRSQAACSGGSSDGADEGEPSAAAGGSLALAATCPGGGSGGEGLAVSAVPWAVGARRPETLVDWLEACHSRRAGGAGCVGGTGTTGPGWAGSGGGPGPCEAAFVRQLSGGAGPYPPQLGGPGHHHPYRHQPYQQQQMQQQSSWRQHHHHQQHSLHRRKASAAAVAAAAASRSDGLIPRPWWARCRPSELLAMAVTGRQARAAPSGPPSVTASWGDDRDRSTSQGSAFAGLRSRRKVAMSAAGPVAEATTMNSNPLFAAADAGGSGQQMGMAAGGGQFGYGGGGYGGMMMSYNAGYASGGSMVMLGGGGGAAGVVPLTGASLVAAAAAAPYSGGAVAGGGGGGGGGGGEGGQWGSNPSSANPEDPAEVEEAPSRSSSSGGSSSSDGAHRSAHGGHGPHSRGQGGNDGDGEEEEDVHSEKSMLEHALASGIEEKIMRLFFFGRPYVLLWLFNIIFAQASLTMTMSMAFVIPYNKFDSIRDVALPMYIWLPVVISNLLLVFYGCWVFLPQYALLSVTGILEPHDVMEEIKRSKTQDQNEEGVAGLVLEKMTHYFVGCHDGETNLSTCFIVMLASQAGIILGRDYKAAKFLNKAVLKPMYKEFVLIWHDIAWYGELTSEYKVKTVAPIFEEAFTELDEDGSGALSFGELANMIRSLGTYATTGDVEAMLWEIDIDNSHSIGYDEFVKFLVYAFFDTKQLGYIDTPCLLDAMERLGMPINEMQASVLMSVGNCEEGEEVKVTLRQFFGMLEKVSFDEGPGEDSSDTNGGEGGSRRTSFLSRAKDILSAPSAYFLGRQGSGTTAASKGGAGTGAGGDVRKQASGSLHAAKSGVSGASYSVSASASASGGVVASGRSTPAAAAAAAAADMKSRAQSRLAVVSMP